MTARACVYTALVGGYEALNEQPAARGSDLDFVCLTDDPALASDTWRMVRVEPSWPTDHVRTARQLKILGHPAVDRYERSIWIDNSVVLRRDPSFLLDEVHRVPLAMLGHWERRSVLEEFEAVLDLGYDDPGRVREQLNAYALDAPEVLDEAPYATTVLVRRRSASVAGAMRLWMDQVLRYSRRDQLSVNYVLRRTGLAVGRMEGDPRNDDWAAWPCTPGRSRSRGHRAPGALAVPPVALVDGLCRREADVARQLATVTRELELLRAELRARQDVEAEAAARAGSRLDEVARQVADRDARIRDLQASRSWRLTEPLRSLGALARRGLGT